jgi:hypothetical protein
MIKRPGISGIRRLIDSKRELTVQPMRAFTWILLCVFLWTAPSQPAGSRTERVNLFPRLRAGRAITYRIRFRADKTVTTESRVAMPLSPTPLQIDMLCSLQLKILEVQGGGDKALIHARALFDVLQPGEEGASPDKQGDSRPNGSQKKTIEFTIRGDGQLTDVKGDDALLPEEHQVWAEWVSLFAMAGVFPKNGVRNGEKWELDEAEKAAVPIAGLTWLRKSTYVQNEPCEDESAQGSGAASKTGKELETCAVIVTRATLRQKSSKKDATPEDFKLHDLRTTGTARGANQEVAYISLKTGVLMRATEEADQSMEVTVAKADGSNRVHYKVDAKSSAEVLVVADTPIIGH